MIVDFRKGESLKLTPCRLYDGDGNEVTEPHDIYKIDLETGQVWYYERPFVVIDAPNGSFLANNTTKLKLPLRLLNRDGKEVRE